MEMYLFVNGVFSAEYEDSDNRLIITITLMGTISKMVFCHVEGYLSSVKGWRHFRFLRL